jgi:tartrate dehydratase beta subunit/fumarate hydratase class I family protein
MVPFLKICHELGTQLIIAKGINDNVVATMREIGIAYGIAPGGTGAFYGVRISRVLERRYEELGPESFFIVEVEDFPFFVSVGGEVDGHFEQIQ